MVVASYCYLSLLCLLCAIKIIYCFTKECIIFKIVEITCFIHIFVYMAICCISYLFSAFSNWFSLAIIFSWKLFFNNKFKALFFSMLCARVYQLNLTCYCPTGDVCIIGNISSTILSDA